MNGQEHGAVLGAAVSGDDDALAVLVRTYHDRVYRFGRSVCRNRFDAEDAVQNAFVKLARRPDVQRHSGVLSWLMTVVRNGCLRFIRALRVGRVQLSETELTEEEAEDELLSPEAKLERFRVVELVHRAIAGLEPPYREVIVLRDIEGMSGPDVCRALALSEAAMKSRLHRARASLREALLPTLTEGDA